MFDTSQNFQLQYNWTAGNTPLPCSDIIFLLNWCVLSRKFYSHIFCEKENYDLFPIWTVGKGQSQQKYRSREKIQFFIWKFKIIFRHCSARLLTGKRINLHSSTHRTIYNRKCLKIQLYFLKLSTISLLAELIDNFWL